MIKRAEIDTKMEPSIQWNMKNALLTLYMRKVRTGIDGTQRLGKREYIR
jgi:hypothetical protein